MKNEIETAVTYRDCYDAMMADGAAVEPEETYPEGSLFGGCEGDDLILGDLRLTSQMVGISCRRRQLIQYTGRMVKKVRVAPRRDPADWKPGEDENFCIVPEFRILRDWSYNF